MFPLVLFLGFHPLAEAVYFVRQYYYHKWACFGPPEFRSLQQEFRYFDTMSSSGRRGHGISVRILPVTREVWVFPWPHFSDTGTISKYRYSALDGTGRIRRAEEEPIYFLLFSVSPRLHGAKVLLLVPAVFV